MLSVKHRVKYAAAFYRKAAFPLIAAALASCSLLTPQTGLSANQQAFAACALYTVALETFTPLIPSVPHTATFAQILGTIDTAREKITPQCRDVNAKKAIPETALLKLASDAQGIVDSINGLVPQIRGK